MLDDADQPAAARDQAAGVVAVRRPPPLHGADVAGAVRGELGLVLLGLLPVLTVLGISAPGVAQAEIARGLSVPAASVAWVVVAFTLAIGVSRPAMGRISDFAGVRGLLLGGSCGLLAASAATLVAGSLWQLIAARVLQGASTAAAATAAFTTIAARLQGPARARAFGIVTAGSSLMLGCGPLVGALIVTRFGWRGAVASPAIAAPFGLLALRTMHDLPTHEHELDAVGAGWLIGASGGALTLIQARATHLSRSVIAAVFAATLVSGAALVRHTRRRPDGFIPVRVVSQSRLAWHFAGAAGLNACALGMTVAGPLLLESLRPGWSEVQVGAALVPAAVAASLVALASGGRLGRLGAARVLSLVAMSVAGSLALAAVIATPLTAGLAIACAICGFGGSQVVMMGRIASVLPAGEVGLGLGLLSLAQQLGGSSGAAAAAATLQGAGITTTLALVAGLALAALAALGRARRAERAPG